MFIENKDFVFFFGCFCVETILILTPIDFDFSKLSLKDLNYPLKNPNYHSFKIHLMALGFQKMAYISSGSCLFNKYFSSASTCQG